MRRRWFWTWTRLITVRRFIKSWLPAYPASFRLSLQHVHQPRRYQFLRMKTDFWAMHRLGVRWGAPVLLCGQPWIGSLLIAGVMCGHAEVIGTRSIRESSVRHHSGMWWRDSWLEGLCDSIIMTTLRTLYPRGGGWASWACHGRRGMACTAPDPTIMISSNLIELQIISKGYSQILPNKFKISPCYASSHKWRDTQKK